jgi:hypothetical protein
MMLSPTVDGMLRLVRYVDLPRKEVVAAAAVRKQ